jgi:hypothetical protein
MHNKHLHWTAWTSTACYRDSKCDDRKKLLVDISFEFRVFIVLYASNIYTGSAMKFLGAR